MAMEWYDWTALSLVLVGGLNWGLVGAFDFNLVNWLIGLVGGMEWLERTVYVLVGVASIVSIWRLATN